MGRAIRTRLRGRGAVADSVDPDRRADPFTGPRIELQGEYTVDRLQAQITEALDKTKKVPLSLLAEVTTLILPQLGAQKEVRTLAQDNFQPLRAKFEKENEHLAFYFSGVLQVVILLDYETAKLEVLFGSLPVMDMDWERARTYLFQAHSLGDRCQLWVHSHKEKLANAMRAYGIAILAVDTLEREAWRRIGGPPARADDPEPEPANTSSNSPRFEKELADVEGEAERAEQLLTRAAEQSSQFEYSKGAAIGAAIVAVLTTLIGWGLYDHELPAYVIVAFPAGALGAMLSVMNRLHSGSLALDYRASRTRLIIFGAFRPLIGAVFGMVTFAVLETGQLPAIEIPSGLGPQLAFVGLLGFLSGFNERFAQDFISHSAENLKPV